MTAQLAATLFGLAIFWSTTHAATVFPDPESLRLNSSVKECMSQISLKKLVTSEERIRSHGYPVESHFMETSDGYILNLFRLPYSHKLQNQFEYRPAILLQHGLISNSDCWLNSGPENSLAYNLVDAGYDVWLGNARGNIYSRNNSRLSPNHPNFWRFSWHEIGTIDVPEMIDYILKQTGQSSLHYAGHSQGTTVFLVLMSMRPEYNQKVKSAHLLAPCAFFEHTLSYPARMLMPLVGKPGGIWNQALGSMEFFPENSFINRLADTSCGEKPVFGRYCKNLYIWLLGEDDTNTNMTSVQVLIETHPGGISSDQGIHFIQLHVSHKFRQYDFGERGNMKNYNQKTPPDYDLSKITASTYLYSGANDGICGPRDVDTLVSKFTHLTNDYRVPEPHWNHMDFIAANQVKEVINDRVIRICNELEHKSNEHLKNE